MLINFSMDNILPIYRNDFLDYSKRFSVFYGGAGSGKSYYITQKLITKALLSPRKILVIRKFATSIKDSVFTLIIEILKDWGLYPFCKINLSTYTIELPNSSKFICKGLDDEEKLKSIQGITDVWIEEATEITEQEFIQLDLRIRAKVDNQQIYLSFNPISKTNWVYIKWFAPECVIDDKTLIIKSTYKDNPYLPKEYIDSLEALIRNNPHYYKVYVLGEFTSLDKLIYTNWIIEEFNPKEIKNAASAIGLDFGYVNDASALIITLIDNTNNNIYIYDEHYQTGLLNYQIADIIKYKGISKEIIVADSAEQKSIDEIRRLGILKIKPAEKGQGSVNAGIDKLKSYKLIIHPKCVNTITELQNYSWAKDKSGEYTNTPIDSFNHCLDALRYAIQAQGGRIKVYNKALLGI